MNDLLAPIYEFFFDYTTYQDLLKPVYNNADYGKLGMILLVIPILLLVIFYKLWEPMRKQRLMWFITIAVILIIICSATTGILYNNHEILQYIADLSDGQPNPDYFIFQMSLISVLFSAILSLVFTFIIKRFSINNSHNPF